MGSTAKALHPALLRQGHGVTADGEFNMPTRVLFGRGTAAQVGAQSVALGGTRLMVVTDPGVRKAGLLDPVLADLASCCAHVVVFSEVEPNPRDLDCVTGAKLAVDEQIDLIVGFGGGSAIDTAKCIALLVSNGGVPADWEDFGALVKAPLPVIAVPTTAGTGSEVSPSAVITDTVRKKKMNLFDVRNCPTMALEIGRAHV